MSDDFLSRWSRRKHEANKGVVAEEKAVPLPGPVAPAEEEVESVVQAEAESPEPLPPIESLTPESDFTAFMKPNVEPALKRAALKTLFADPRFNVMDGLDVYIDDYSKPDPISQEMVRALHHARYIFAPPATRVNEAGFVEDVPEEIGRASCRERV